MLKEFSRNSEDLRIWSFDEIVGIVIMEIVCLIPQWVKLNDDGALEELK